VNEIEYSAPSGITPTANVTFAYDAAGNRTSMTDGLGTKSYSYNSLSQMTSETRTFTGVGAFTLSYDYNLAGELKKITDATNMTVNYGCDSNGRVSSPRAGFLWLRCRR
jgi:YD repeat-containing protein